MLVSGSQPVDSLASRKKNYETTMSRELKFWNEVNFWDKFEMKTLKLSI